MDLKTSVLNTSILITGRMKNNIVGMETNMEQLLAKVQISIFNMKFEC